MSSATAKKAENVERTAQVAYWEEHTQQATMEAMMLDSKASEIDKLERPEVLGLLGDITGRRVLELGAGIGRFTSDLAKSATKVAAYDFMESLTEQNKKTNGDLPNVEIQKGDVTKLELEESSFDVIFSNWLLMYLSDEEVESLALRALTWLSDTGMVFFRESCFKQSGDMTRSSNPSHYRDPNSYFCIFDKVSWTDSKGRKFRFELVNARCVETYVRIKQNHNQIAFKWKKVEVTDSDVGDFRHFLDNCQYQMRGILRYERIFGAGYISTGGAHTTEELVAKLNLKKGEHVLDVGCGIGGGNFYMAEKYGVSVLGVDLSVNMFMVALERSLQKDLDVVFEVADITKREYPKQSFDVVYSRDTILHIDDKPKLFQRLYGFLKPGGRLLITDYCRADKTPSDQFAAYIKQRGYDLHSVNAYSKMLQDAGFVNVQGEDTTALFETSLRRELATAEANKESFIADFSEQDYFAIVNGWREKLDRVSQGEQRWGLFIAEKAT
ncbi:hypothetical protein BSKO_11952 [Bryopsis sp. KO-2023]|nr:hypothetical protein BSKO_11952 [Bryopsis sp. KO-2023]